MFSRRAWILAAVGLGAVAAGAALRGPASGPGGGTSSSGAVPRRIVSLAPSTTELLFALGLGDRVVGVCDYCAHPPETASIPRMGGYYTPNFEALARAKPDLVVLLPEHGPVRERLLALGPALLDLDHRNVAGILESILLLGRAGGAEPRALALRGELEARLHAVRERCKDRPRPRVLVSVGRAMNEGGVLRITACGKGGFYDDLLELAGGTNAYEGPLRFPALSPEGVLALKPDLVLEIMPDLDEKKASPASILADWAALPGLAGLRVALLAKPYAIVPGPRLVSLLEDVAELLHPGLRRE
jgi:iron complex transport system substrate-binding protein